MEKKKGTSGTGAKEKEKIFQITFFRFVGGGGGWGGIKRPKWVGGSMQTGIFGKRLRFLFLKVDQKNVSFRVFFFVYISVALRCRSIY